MFGFNMVPQVCTFCGEMAVSTLVGTCLDSIWFLRFVLFVVRWQSVHCHIPPPKFSIFVSISSTSTSYRQPRVGVYHSTHVVVSSHRVVSVLSVVVAIITVGIVQRDCARTRCHHRLRLRRVLLHSIVRWLQGA